MQIAIRELKNHFSKYLKIVQEGTEIIVTTHGKPIARFSQLGVNKDTSDNNVLQNIQWVKIGNGKKTVGLSDDKKIIIGSGKSLSDLLLDDRG